MAGDESRPFFFLSCPNYILLSCPYKSDPPSIERRLLINLQPIALFSQKLTENSLLYCVRFRPLIMESRPGTNQSQEQRETTKNPEDLTAFVKNLLEQMQTRFQTMSQSIITRIDEMGSRIEDLEKSIEDLSIETAGEVSPSSSLSPSDRGGTN